MESDRVDKLLEIIDGLERELASLRQKIENERFVVPSWYPQLGSDNSAAGPEWSKNIIVY
jgi:hypothetical protein